MGTLSTVVSGADLRRRLPAPIWRRLWAMLRRARRVTLLKGFFVVLTTGLLCLLGVMAVDALVTILSRVFRLTLSLGALAVVLGAAWWWMVRPLFRRMDLAEVARMVEQRHPELEETVSSAVEFLASDEPEEIRGSAELIGEVVKSAVRDVDTISPQREFSNRAARPWVLSVMAIGSVLVLAGVIWPKPTLRLLVRAVAPFQDAGNAYADTLQVSPGDTRVAAGSDVTIEVSIRHPRLKRATVRRQESEDRPEGVERMNLVGTGDGQVRFSLAFPAVHKDFTYRVHAGNAVSRRFSVRVIEPPRVEQVQVRYEYPEYTGLPPREAVCEGGEIAALEHTKVRVRAEVNEPVPEALFIRGGNVGKALPAKQVEGSGPEWEWVMGRREDQSWEIRLRDEEGFPSQPVTGLIRSIPDAAPEVRLVSPEGSELRLRPSEYLPLTYEAKEDFGFARAELILRLDGRPTPVVQPVSLPVAAGGGVWTGKAGLALSELDLAQVNRLTLQLRLADTLPADWGGGQEALSDTVTIVLEKGAKLLVEQVLAAQEQEIRREVEKARQELQQAKQRGEEAVRQFARADSVDALKRLEESRRSTEQAEKRLSELGAKMEATAFAEPAKELKELAGGPVRQARERAETAPLTDRVEERNQHLREMGENLNRALNEMNEIVNGLQKSKDEARRMAELARLAQEQQRLAQQAKREMLDEQMAQAMQAARKDSPTEPLSNMTAQALAAWKREQEQLQREMAELLRKDPEAMRAAMEAQAKEAAAMAKEAEALKGEQKKLEELTGGMDKASEGRTEEELRRGLLGQLRMEEESIEQDAKGLHRQLQKQYPAAADAHEQLAQASAQAQRAVKEMGKNQLAAAKEAAAAAQQELQKVAGEARDELAKEAIRERAEQALEGTAVQEGKLSAPVEEALDALARNVAEKLVETPWPEGQPVSLDEKLGEAVNAVKQAMAETPPSPAAGTPGGEKVPAADAEALAQAVTEKGEAMLQRWMAGKEPVAERPMSPPAPVPADAEAVRNLKQLAERQASVARVLDALARGQLGEALAARQEQVAGEAAEMSGEAAELQKAAANLPNQGRAQADQARSQLDQAEKQAMAAARDLARAQQAQDQKQAEQAMAAAAGGMGAAEAMERARNGEVPPAPATEAEKSALRSTRQSQQRTAEALSQAAQRLQTAGESLAAGAKAAKAGRPAPQPQLMNPDDLARSFANVSRAAQAEDAGEASSHASRAAEDLRKMAWKMADGMGQMGNWAESLMPGDQAAQPQQAAGAQEKAAAAGGTESFRMGSPEEQVRGDGVPAEIAKWGVSAEDWARLKGTLGSNVTQEQRAGMPLEYRGLVGDYFRALAEEARKGGEQTAPPSGMTRENR